MVDKLGPYKKLSLI